MRRFAALVTASCLVVHIGWGGLCAQAESPHAKQASEGSAAGRAKGIAEVGPSACDSKAAKLLRADAKRATRWNWGWGAVYLGATIGQGTVAHLTSNEDLKVSLWTGATKAGLGVLNQIIFPKRIYAPNANCSDLAERIAEAREVERKGHNWFAHGSVIAANVAGFAIVAGLTKNYVLATSGTVIGSLVGEFAIYTGPNGLRSAGLGVDSLVLMPSVSSEFRGLSLSGRF